MGWSEKVIVNYELSDGRIVNKNDIKTADKTLMPKLFIEGRKVYDEIRMMLFENTPEDKVSEMLVKQDGFVKLIYSPNIDEKAFRERLEKRGMKGAGLIV